MRHGWRNLLAGFGLALLAAQAGAGAWPREPGEAFMALTQRHGRGAEGSELTLYGEYGAGNGWTLGIDAALEHHAGRIWPGRTLMFARRGFGNGAFRQAVGLGLGGTFTAGGYEPMLQPGWHLGYGFGHARKGWPRAEGWVGLDLTAEIRRESTTLKADATVGLRPHPRLMLIGQLQAAQDSRAGWRTLHAAPQVVLRIRPGFDLTAGIRTGLAGNHGRAITFGTWTTFTRR